jgi:hypothetical protein
VSGESEETIMNFENIDNETLNANYDAIKGMAGMEALAALMLAELDYREENAVKIAETAALRMLAEKASETLASIARSAVPSVADSTGAVYRHAAFTLRELIMVAYDMSTHKAQKVIMVLTDTRGQTDCDGTVKDAAEYVETHPKSTVYSATSPDDADKGTKTETSTKN